MDQLISTGTRCRPSLVDVWLGLGSIMIWVKNRPTLNTFITNGFLGESLKG